jgi:hypothetical protein
MSQFANGNWQKGKGTNMQEVKMQRCKKAKMQIEKINQV